MNDYSEIGKRFSQCKNPGFGSNRNKSIENSILNDGKNLRFAYAFFHTESDVCIKHKIASRPSSME